MKKVPGTEYLFLLGKIGAMVLGSILFFFFIGLSIDRWLGTPGYGMIAGTFMGLAGGFYLTYKTIMNLPKLDQKETPATDVKEHETDPGISS